MKLSLVAIEKDAVVRLCAEGQITAADFPAGGSNPLEGLMGQTWSANRVLLDCSKLSYIDSSAVGWLIGSHKAFKAGGGALVLHSIPAAVMQILNLLKIGKLIPLAANESAGRAALNHCGMEAAR